ncbi:hypothetical protein J7F03_12285 [Streptomyces sp. ISL-43]|uniref:hypothetical protein n=1 Tax=Streptomyces sp. ISL-43 TaxID=2819183 RepID=UPI001BE799FD|nr:hypothetical protein [Streptomyces sp. ISL-43]MBT2447838.1 hypothetical protein [Streptomyces sp. ISL-43]
MRRAKVLGTAVVLAVAMGISASVAAGTAFAQLAAVEVAPGSDRQSSDPLPAPANDAGWQGPTPQPTPSATTADAGWQ